MRSSMLRATCMTMILALAVGPALAQTKPPPQKVTPPEARYWMGATTGGGMMSAMSMGTGVGDMMRMGMGGMPEFSQSVDLRLGTSLSPTGAPEAFHAFPAGARVNQPIFLETPKLGKSQPGQPGQYEKPKGRIKFFWGCGEKAPKGQPVVLDFEKLANGQMPDAQLSGIDANEVRKPSTTNSKTYGDYPNGADKNRRLEARFQPGASLAGDHKITGTYTPEIKFNLKNSFMDPVRYTATAKGASGAVNLSWNGVGRATGYALGVIGGREGQNQTSEMVIWSSSNQPATFIMHEDLAPAEVARLIKAKAVLPPTQTSCSVPAEVIVELAKSGGEGPSGGGMLAFTAFGDQETFIYPERPADPKVTWDQEWFTRVNFKSIRMDMIGPDGVTDMAQMMAGARGGQQNTAQMSDAEYCKMVEQQNRSTGQNVGEAVGAATGIPGGGMLGRAIGGLGKKKDEKPKDPRCK